MLKKILLSFCLFLLVFLSFELYICYGVWGGPNKSIKFYIDNIILTMSTDKYFNNLYNNIAIENSYTPSFRPDENIKSNLSPILFMGCSFTYGDGLKEDKIISAKTAKLTNRPTYNRAGNGWGLDQLVYQLRREDLITKIPEPEFLIYTFISDHFARINKYKIEPMYPEFQPHFKIDKNGVLKELKPSFLDYFYIREHYLYNKYYRFGLSNIEKQNIIKIYFYAALNSMRKYWKNTKFVILLYPISQEEDFFEFPCWEEMEKDFIIIDINKLTHENIDKYKCADGWHPSAEAWDIILPKLFNQLNIKYNE